MRFGLWGRSDEGSDLFRLDLQQRKQRMGCPKCASEMKAVSVESQDWVCPDCLFNWNPKKKLYTKRGIQTATFWGGPLATAYLLSQNYKTLDNQGAARKALYLGIGMTALLFGVLAALPDLVSRNLPNWLIPLVNVAIAYAILERWQGNAIDLHTENGGGKASGWKAAGIGVICGLATLAYVVILLLASEFFSP